MKKLLLVTVLFIGSALNGHAFAAVPLTLTWDAYTDSDLPNGTPSIAADYTIEARCRVNTDPLENTPLTASTPANNNSLTLQITVAPGDTIGCQIRAKRNSDAQTSPWIHEVQINVPFVVPTPPLNLQLHL